MMLRIKKAAYSNIMPIYGHNFQRSSKCYPDAAGEYSSRRGGTLRTLKFLTLDVVVEWSCFSDAIFNPFFHLCCRCCCCCSTISAFFSLPGQLFKAGFLLLSAPLLSFSPPPTWGGDGAVAQFRSSFPHPLFLGESRALFPLPWE